MSFANVTLHVVVDQKDKAAVKEVLAEAVDGVVSSNIPVFDSDIAAPMICDVANADEIRREFATGTIQT